MSTRKQRRKAIEEARRAWLQPCIVCGKNTVNTHGVCTPCLQRDRDDHAFDWARGVMVAHDAAFHDREVQRNQQ